jgi:uncharacterized repeat protein (TIGR01451 family)
MRNRIFNRVLMALAAVFTAALLGYCPAMAADAPPGPLVNTANVSYMDAGGALLHAPPSSATVIISQVGGSALTITKSVSNNKPTPGDSVTYTITVKNTGASAMTNVTVTDNLASILGISTFVSGSIKLSGSAQSDSLLSGNIVTAPIGTLGPGASATLAFSVSIIKPSSHAQAASLSGAGVSNVAEAAADGASPVDSAPVSITVLSPVINMSKTVSPATAKSGDTVTFTIAAQNAGNDTAKNVVIKDDLGALPVTYKAGTLRLNGTLQPNPSGSLIQVNISSVGAGATATVTFDATVN